MAHLFDERERTAENIFVHEEESRFLAHRRGMEAIAVWAADSMGLTPEDRSTYTQRIVDAFVSGTPEDRLVTAIQTDLERAGKPALSTNVGTVLAQAVAEATLTLRGQPDRVVAPQAQRTRSLPKQSPSWGWGL